MVMPKKATKFPGSGGGRQNTGRFMSEDMWNEKIPDRPYMTDESGQDIDSQSDTGAYLTLKQRAEADAEFARQDKIAGEYASKKTLGGGYGKTRVAEDARKKTNLTGSRSSSILTS